MYLVAYQINWREKLELTATPGRQKPTLIL